VRSEAEGRIVWRLGSILIHPSPKKSTPSSESYRKFKSARPDPRRRQEKTWLTNLMAESTRRHRASERVGFQHPCRSGVPGRRESPRPGVRGRVSHFSHRRSGPRWRGRRYRCLQRHDRGGAGEDAPVLPLHGGVIFCRRMQSDTPFHPFRQFPRLDRE
jgi:hypothetical protein